MITLVIKGTIVDVERALMLHGLNPSDWLSQPIPTVATKAAREACTVNVADDTPPGIILRWFAEPPTEPPFPVGTLLHYHVHYHVVPKPDR